MKIERRLITNSALGNLLVLFGLSLGLSYLSSCSEKKAETPSSSATNPTGSGSGTATAGDDDDDDDNGGTSGGESTYDLCADGLEKSSKLDKWSKLVKELCSSGKLKELRKTANVYSGGDTTVMHEEDIASTTTEMQIYSSGLYNATASDYWDLVRLQTTDPGAYKDHYQTDSDVEMKDVNASSSSSTYNYINNSGEGGEVNYVGKTSFITLEKDQAYVAATELVESKETMKDLKGLIIVNKKSSSKVEVFTISYQTYEHEDGQGKQLRDRAITSCESEQKRAYQNAKTADKAKDYLD